MIAKYLRSHRKRQRQLRKFAKQLNFSTQGRLIRLFIILSCIVSLHAVAIAWLENIPIWSAVWLTFTTITTVGYGDISAQTPLGQLTTILCMYIFGIWLLAQLAGEYIDFRMDRRAKMIKGQWRWKEMTEHIVIINSPIQDRDRYLTRLVEQVRTTPELATIPIQLLTNAYKDGLPQTLREMAVVHYSGSCDDANVFETINLLDAKFIIILAEDAHDPKSDSVTLDILDRLKRIKHHAYILAESVQDDNKIRFMEHNANAVMRPIRAYPEIVVRALAAPGAEQILENLFRHHGDSTYRYNIELQNRPWRDIACTLVAADLGTPLGYIDAQNHVETNPPANLEVTTKAIIILVRENAIPTETQISQALAVPPT